MKKALLIIDRGSREPEVREELEIICSIVKAKGGYHYTDYFRGISFNLFMNGIGKKS